MAVEDGTKRSVLSTPQLITIIILTGLLGGLISGYFGHRLLKSMGPGGKDLPIHRYDEPDPDERPPIIVSNGSVIIMGDKTNSDGGTWDGDKSKWTHVHTKLPAGSLQVRAMPANQLVCRHKKLAGTYATPFTDKKFQLEYTYLGKQVVLTISIQGGSVQLDYPSGVEPSPDVKKEVLTTLSDEGTSWKLHAGDYTCIYPQPKSTDTFAKTELRFYQLK